MAPNYFLKPETALNKAKDLIKVGKKSNALEILYDMMRSRRSKVWQKNLHDVMILLADLCVELKKNLQFRKVIHQYKNVALQEAPQSLESVLRHYLDSIKGFTDEACQKSKDAVLDIDDLDALDSPESLMLNAVNIEGAQDRSDRAILMPWLRFLWEAYRIVLDLLRSVAKFEKFYHEIAHDAYEFCIKYGRRNEFKKLSDMLRTHTTRNTQMTPTATGINMNNVETQTLQLQTRLRQLDCALELEMYNDAFRTVEDIYSLFLIARKNVRPLLMADYYSRAAELFQRSGCHLFHAAALLKLLNLHRDHKKSSTTELTPMVCRVLCAILAIPLPHERMHFDKFLISSESSVSKLKTLSNLLNMSSIPNRQSLIKEITRIPLQKLLPKELFSMFNVYENEFQPLKLYEMAKPGLDYVSNDDNLKSYHTLLLEVCSSKTVLQVAQVYKSVNFDELCKLCPYMKPLKFERLLVDLVHNLELPILIDHRKNAVHFDVFTDMGISQRKYGPLAGLPCDSKGASTDQLSRHLTIFAEVLQNVNDMISVNDDTASDKLNNIRTTMVQEYLKSAKKQRKVRAERVNIIERTKEIIERECKNRQKYFMDMESKRKEKEQKEQEAEERRLQEEAKERERRRHEEEAQRIKRNITRQQITNHILKSDIGKANKTAWSNLTEEQLDEFDAMNILEKTCQEAERKRRDLLEKSRNRAKNLDYMSRAMRLEEMPLLIKQAEATKREREEFLSNFKIELRENAKIEHEKMLEDKTRLKRLGSYFETVREKLAEISEVDYQKKLAEWEEAEKKRLEEEREAREREEQRLEEERLEKERLAAEQMAAQAKKEEQSNRSVYRVDPHKMDNRDRDSHNEQRSFTRGNPPAAATTTTERSGGGMWERGGAHRSEAPAGIAASGGPAAGPTGGNDSKPGAYCPPFMKAAQAGANKPDFAPRRSENQFSRSRGGPPSGGMIGNSSANSSGPGGASGGGSGMMNRGGPGGQRPSGGMGGWSKGANLGSDNRNDSGFRRRNN